MKGSVFTAVSATSILLLSSSVTAQSTATGTGLKPITTLGCYKNSNPLTLFGEYAFATDGWCQEACGLNNTQPVMGIVGGSTCYCGNELPPLDQMVPSSNCNTPCNGYGTKNCGGMGFWQIYLTGITTNVQTAPNGTTGSSSSGMPSTTSSSPSVITKAGETVIVTASASASTGALKEGGSSKIGIAVGVVVGVLVVACIIGGLLLCLKQRRKRAIEEEHKRNAALNDFVGNKKSEAVSTDARLDPVIFSHRRDSIGSIADEMDYSRRILQVRCNTPTSFEQILTH